MQSLPSPPPPPNLMNQMKIHPRASHGSYSQDISTRLPVVQVLLICTDAWGGYLDSYGGSCTKPRMVLRGQGPQGGSPTPICDQCGSKLSANLK
ncbi:uncharacterized protein LOC113353461 isoform X2 [Papaver somniferum]|uniref:uncharacterized protein LOC113353461 isoform X2 n=1 Tax=Papaver somniferum TaxID=3469 RepID=UPI000E6FF740|nr:uncharacterized protein LOC113353461 isoform X2 [Papaver somniferum]